MYLKCIFIDSLLGENVDGVNCNNLHFIGVDKLVLKSFIWNNKKL